MAATRGLTVEQQERARAAIQTTQLVKRLQFFALNEPDPASGIVPELDAGRLKAVEILLRKSLPDISAVTLSGDPNKPIGLDVRGEATVKLASMIDAVSARKTGGPAA